MADLNVYKIPTFIGVNDEVVTANSQSGCNGTFICFAINNIIDEVNILKNTPSGGGGIFTITKDAVFDLEFNYLTLIQNSPFDFYGVSLFIDNPDSFFEFYLEVNGQQRFITDVNDANNWTIDNPIFRAGDSVDFVVVADEVLVNEGYSESVSVVFTASFSPLSPTPPAP
ncbi:hypothetical protein Xen7305DRAFT_00046600 [Xenococcus sp. PCC 7305]|uniref:hypothetical protein n=1 Tax=Xenococcus sp. PCC 7305 TaxID=102125 RepID=UPI0002ACDE36|nr:hypothetical protein [Xenococcus sp. PCC 7305]ELS04924.1 hypothetical protein Xen7305DRAFT_00046600 [Xenococcus sp. PCC 7305]